MDAGTRQGGRIGDIRRFLDGLFDDEVPAKQVELLGNATLVVMTSASLAVSVIGPALAQARGLLTQHAIKPVDRLLSHPGIVVWDLFAHWVPEGIGDRRNMVWAWTVISRSTSPSGGPILCSVRAACFTT